MIHDSLKVSLVQGDIQLENSSANIKHHNELLKQVPSDTQLIVLPEMFSTGFSMNTGVCAEGMDGKTVRWLRSVATQRNTAIIAGVMVREDGSCYNRALFIYPDGTYKHYDKRHLFRYGNEENFYKAGNEQVIVEYLGWRFCLQICYDLRFPVWSRNQNSYDVLVYIASWPDARQAVWSVLPIARAIENQCYVLAVNRVGNDSSGNYAGESRIVSPKGTTATEAELYKEQAITGVLSLSELQQFREKFNVSADADKFSIL